MSDGDRLREIAKEMGDLVAAKNEAYGRSFSRTGKILELLFPTGVRPEQYRDLLAIARVLDKMFRIVTRKDAFGESPWRDCVGYSILSVAADEEEARAADRMASDGERERRSAASTTYAYDVAQAARDVLSAEAGGDLPWVPELGHLREALKRLDESYGKIAKAEAMP